MEKDALRDSLIALRLDPQDYDALKALPLLYVAWADGWVDHRAARKILDIARQSFAVEVGAKSVIIGWLRRRPSERYFMDGMVLLRRLAELPDELHVVPEDLQQTLMHCEEVARISADDSYRISRAQEESIRRVALLLGVDGGRSWSEILAELDELPRHRNDPQAALRSKTEAFPVARKHDGPSSPGNPEPSPRRFPHLV